MWCPKCESEVATEVAADGQSLLCVSCRGQVRRVTVPSLHPDIRRAREILDRLSAATDSPAEEDNQPHSHDEPVELDDVIAAHSPAAEADEAVPEPAPQPSPRQFRVDRAHPAAEMARTHLAGDKEQPVESARLHSKRSDPPHTELPAPHFDVEPARPRTAPGRSESAWGQLMAYAGVAVLTVGTALVVWGYLGGPPSYAPTGWLVATAGQMLLLLGVVTLVAGGMQQTTHDVSSRVAHLNGRVIRMEQTANEILRGPHLGKARQRSPIAAENADEADSE